MAPRFIQNLVLKKTEKDPNEPTFWEAAKSLTLLQYAMFFSGWLAWTCDALDFFSVSLAVTALGEQFNRPTTDITTSITLTLLFRSLGALVFGLASDRYGRKWTLVLNLMVCGAFSLATGFVTTFQQFLAVRAIFGIAMGGVWGLASATALETLPVQVRGLASGIIQEGYAMGNMLAAIINLTLVPEQSHTWRAMFWTAAGLSFLAAFVRACLPESEIFLKARAAAKASGKGTKKKTSIFFHETIVMLKKHWKLWIYASLLMSGFNFLSHGSQDLFPTYMQTTKHKSAREATIATIIGNCGAIVGGALCGAVSQYIGRRLAICLFMVTIGAFIPLWILPSSFAGLSAGAFFIQIGVQGPWGAIPVFLNEISPPAFRGTFPGLSYQIGNMVSSASAQIEATGGVHQRIIVDGVITPNYCFVQGIFIGVVAAFTLVLALFGPEKHAAHFERNKLAFEEGGGDDAVRDDEELMKARSHDDESSVGEKGRGNGSQNGSQVEQIQS